MIQGYGLTETAPIVSLNHPFSTSKGSVGKAIAGVEVRIAPDGEILVRGDNVTTGYFNRDAATAEAFEGGWFHTGDIGEVDAQGRLFIKGRKKEMIVTPEGLNVFPEDVERVVAGLAGVRDVAVVGARTGSEERVHAVVVLDPGIDPQAIVRQANLRTARPSEDSRDLGVAVGRAAADGGHAQAAAPGAARLGGHRRGATANGVGRHIGRGDRRAVRRRPPGHVGHDTR